MVGRAPLRGESDSFVDRRLFREDLVGDSRPASSGEELSDRRGAQMYDVYNLGRGDRQDDG